MHMYDAWCKIILAYYNYNYSPLHIEKMAVLPKDACYCVAYASTYLYTFLLQFHKTTHFMAACRSCAVNGSSIILVASILWGVYSSFQPFQKSLPFKALSHKCRIRLRNECHFLASVDICFMPIDPLNGRSSLWNVRCMCVLFFSFVNVIRFLIVKRHLFLVRWPCGTRVTSPLNRGEMEGE